MSKSMIVCLCVCVRRRSHQVFGWVGQTKKVFPKLGLLEETTLRSFAGSPHRQFIFSKVSATQSAERLWCLLTSKPLHQIVPDAPPSLPHLFNESASNPTLISTSLSILFIRDLENLVSIPNLEKNWGGEPHPLPGWSLISQHTYFTKIHTPLPSVLLKISTHHLLIYIIHSCYILTCYTRDLVCGSLWWFYGSSSMLSTLGHKQVYHLSHEWMRLHPSPKRRR